MADKECQCGISCNGLTIDEAFGRNTSVTGKASVVGQGACCCCWCCHCCSFYRCCCCSCCCCCCCCCFCSCCSCYCSCCCCCCSALRASNLGAISGGSFLGPSEAILEPSRTVVWWRAISGNLGPISGCSLVEPSRGRISGNLGAISGCSLAVLMGPRRLLLLRIGLLRGCCLAGWVDTKRVGNNKNNRKFSGSIFVGGGAREAS